MTMSIRATGARGGGGFNKRAAGDWGIHGKRGRLRGGKGEGAEGGWAWGAGGGRVGRGSGGGAPRVYVTVKMKAGGLRASIETLGENRNE